MTAPRPHPRSGSHSRARALLAALAAALLLPTAAFAQEESASVDALGNTGNVGSGAVFRPQTPRDILLGGGTLVLADTTADIDVAGVQAGLADGVVAAPDALGNFGNVGSGAVFRPQTPADILQGGGTLAWMEGIAVAGVYVEAVDGGVRVSVPVIRRVVPQGLLEGN